MGLMHNTGHWAERGKLCLKLYILGIIIYTEDINARYKPHDSLYRADFPRIGVYSCENISTHCGWKQNIMERSWSHCPWGILLLYSGECVSRVCIRYSQWLVEGRVRPSQWSFGTPRGKTQGNPQADTYPTYKPPTQPRPGGQVRGVKDQSWCTYVQEGQESEITSCTEGCRGNNIRRKSLRELLPHYRFSIFEYSSRNRIFPCSICLNI